MPWEKQFDEEGALEKAKQAFWTQGYEATSLQDLVDCMGINRGSLYATYGDKRQLFIAALKSYDLHIRHGLLDEFERSHPPREAIRQVFATFTSGISEGAGNRGCFLTNTALELAAHDKEIRKIVAGAQAQMEKFFARMIDEGKAQGEISVRVDTAATARGLLASLLGLVVLTRSRPERALLSGIVDEALGRLG